MATTKLLKRTTPGTDSGEGLIGSGGAGKYLPDVVNVRVEFTLYGSASQVAADYATALTAIDGLATAKNLTWYKTS